MSEEEIIKIIKEKIILDFNCYNSIDKIELEAIQSLLDLYNKEKEKNKKIQEYIDKHDLLYSCNYMEDGIVELFKDILNIAQGNKVEEEKG